MSRVPVSQAPVRRGGLSWLRRKDAAAPAPLIVAEALTEEEAATELAAERDARETEKAAVAQAERERQERVEADRERRRAAKEAKRAAREERRARRGNPFRAGDASAFEHEKKPVPFLRIARQKVTFSLGTVGVVVAVATFSTVMLFVYGWGQKSGNGGGNLETITGRAPGQNGEGGGSPLLSRDSGKRRGAAARNQKISPDPDLSNLLVPPRIASADPAASKTMPDRIVANTAAAVAVDKSLNYLQIESFRVNRYNTWDQIGAHVEDVRSFLLTRGIRTIARVRSDRYVLFSKTGYKTGPAGAAAREAFRSRIEQLGRAYRDSGGQYEFKGAFFVNHEKAHLGRRL